MDDQLLTDAYRQIRRERGASVDAVLEDPERRREFLAAARRLLGDLPERELLHRLVNLRKRRRLPTG